VTLSSESAERISLLYSVAKTQGSLVSVQELLELLPERASEDDLVEAISSAPSLSSKFELRAGYITEKLGESEADFLLSSEARSRLTARTNMRFAVLFVPFLHSSRFKMVAVSGSTSYRSASRSRDLDLFCVAPSGRMWLSLTLGLIAARVFGLRWRKAPQVCLSCVMDEDFALRLFASQQGPLFARDALETKVMKGRQTYQSLLDRARWISDVYPSAYAATKRPSPDPPRRSPRPSAFDYIVNRFLYFTVGTYIKAKSALLNRRLTAMGQVDGVFEIRSAEDHLIYESKRYADLRREYSAVLSARTAVQD
jgi:hypothetical protein